MGLQLVNGSPEDILDITSDVLPFNSNYAVGWWMMLSGDWSTGGPWEFFAILDDDDSYRDSLILSTDGNIAIRHFGAEEGFVGSAGAVSLPSQPDPFHVALIRDGDDLILSLDGVFGTPVAAGASGRTDPESMRLWLGQTHTEDMDFGAMKAWTKALTEAQIRSEMLTNAPWDGDSVYAHWPFFAAGLADYSGHGRDWSLNTGSVTAVDNPEPVIWGRTASHIYSPVSAAPPAGPAAGLRTLALTGAGI